MPDRLYEGADWDFMTLQRITDACERIAHAELGLDVYRNQIEIISSEQMLDAYASSGMPHFYKHWSFGKRFAYQQALYSKGLMGLAYEIVINSSPCISYLMEENTATMQTLVIAHAAFGHNHFFKNNSVFKQWTDADGILDYLNFAREYIRQCEEKHGAARVELLLDAAHALMSHGIDRYPQKRPPNLKAEQELVVRRAQQREQEYNDVLFRTTPKGEKKTVAQIKASRRKDQLQLPQENLLKFLERESPSLELWQREVLRIVRKIAQYFYPQTQTKVMNEGCATYVHYRIMNRLREQGSISEGNFLEFLQSHTNVIFQPGWNDPRYSGWNPYALGFAIMRDIEGIVTGLDEYGRPRTSEQICEDREWFPQIAGKGDPMGVLRDAWVNYRDESFINQFLSPRLIRDFRIMHVTDDPEKKEGLEVKAIQDKLGYRKIRTQLSRLYDPSLTVPNIEIVDADLEGDRMLILQHRVSNGSLLEERDLRACLQAIADIWGYPVKLVEVSENGSELRSSECKSNRLQLLEAA